MLRAVWPGYAVRFFVDNGVNLAAAYGVAVSTTMVMTTVLFGDVARRHFGWSRPFLVALCTLFLGVDVAFFADGVQDSRRRLVPAGRRSPDLHNHDHVAQRSTDRTGTDEQEHAPAPRVRQRLLEGLGRAHAGRERVPDQRGRRHSSVALPPAPDQRR